MYIYLIYWYIRVRQTQMWLLYGERLWLTIQFTGLNDLTMLIVHFWWRRAKYDQPFVDNLHSNSGNISVISYESKALNDDFIKQSFSLDVYLLNQWSLLKWGCTSQVFSVETTSTWNLGGGVRCKHCVCQKAGWSTCSSCVRPSHSSCVYGAVSITPNAVNSLLNMFTGVALKTAVWKGIW